MPKCRRFKLATKRHYSTGLWQLSADDAATFDLLTPALSDIPHQRSLTIEVFSNQESLNYSVA